jgi:hypothetical protein
MPENAELAEALFMGRWGRRLREMTKFYEDKAKAAQARKP